MFKNSTFERLMEAVMIRMTSNVYEAQLVTHAGGFHADEVLATAILEELFENVVVCRTLEVPKNLKSDVIVYDIGGGRWDHHQKGGNGVRENGVPYASAGLIWRDFGPELLKKKYSDSSELLTSVDKMLIRGIDAIDNGIITNSKFEVSSMNISQAISDFNPTWDENENPDEAFKDACEFARQILINTLRRAISVMKARGYVEEAIEKSSNHIMILEKYVSWSRALYFSRNPKALDIWFVIYPSNRVGYNWRTVTISLKKHIPMKAVPDNWLGLKGEEYQKVTGVKTAMFCHHGGFIGAAETQEDAIRLAEIAITS